MTVLQYNLQLQHFVFRNLLIHVGGLYAATDKTYCRRLIYASNSLTAQLVPEIPKQLILHHNGTSYITDGWMRGFNVTFTQTND